MAWYRTPFSESLTTKTTMQTVYEGKRQFCADIELNLMECFEAYGYMKGNRFCRDYIDDYDECINMTRQFRRYILMRQERFKKVTQGEKSIINGYWEKRPPLGSYTEGPMAP